ncbi:2-hydroxy-3-carboxy-6-oxo-7-methylocta-2,4-dienoate decarboxylase [Thermopolyspora flexuosa]|uniref:Aminocarboxymuconate-semialdehyde decarboxylase n=1 Tax=Thermopolyspora flexuosa TaxID=103836 RepID=A0A543IWZ5_9ACTN|nr:amidohydrolase family protein [Thermopolyspora flexuosa]TQM75098.1 aminocarboxymuconate-semialdehyde decarboxylase [Thermopolyspora flexuosa]GGM92132.1 2-hydroxy-3-carboxy-6-oxo-7-methylocta-2,4-dienoate decarboxylase [Thermopolyspora flexuosa]
MTAQRIRVASGVIDVHAHWLPEELYGLPPGSPLPPMRARNGELYLGDLPLSITPGSLSDPKEILADGDRAGIGVRVLSPPPFAFPIGGGAEADDYIRTFNAKLAQVVREGDGRFLGLGLVRLDDAGAARACMRELAALDGIVGFAVPPIIGGRSYDAGTPRELLRGAAECDLAVLVHPMQLPRPEWSGHYLPNLLGNPVETATAIASVVLGGVVDELPDLRICFVHGGGCAPGLLGRWDHGWRHRRDVRAATAKPPSEGFRSLYVDTLTHDPDALRLLIAKAHPDRLVCGSDYPFDMADRDPVRFATGNGLDPAVLEANARAFIGLGAAH